MNKPVITVGHAQDDSAVSVGYPSPLGTPYSSPRDGNPDEIYTKYKTWLYYQIIEGDKAWDELTRLYKIAEKDKKLHLGCWCKSKPCHADFIKELLDIGFSHELMDR